MRNAAAALTFYVEAFDAVELSRLVGDDGRIGHAEIMIGDSKLMLADEYPEIDVVGPETRGGPTCSFTIEVPDVDASFAGPPSWQVQSSSGRWPTSSTATAWDGCVIRSAIGGR